MFLCAEYSRAAARPRRLRRQVLAMSDTREYNTAWARRNRAAKVAAKNANAMRCQAMLANRHLCKTLLQNRFVDGQTVPWCPTCDRKARGICIDCGKAPVYGTAGKALRCPLCKKLEFHASQDRYRKRNRRALKAKEKRRMKDPVKHADRLVYKRLARKLKPSKVAEYKKTYAVRNAEKVRAYHVGYRAKHLEARRERERLRCRGQLASRSCLTCSTVVTGRAKRCAACKRTDQLTARALLAARPGMAA